MEKISRPGLLIDTFWKKINKPGLLIETFQKKNKPGLLIETRRSFVNRHKIEMDLVV